MAEHWRSTGAEVLSCCLWHSWLDIGLCAIYELSDFIHWGMPWSTGSVPRPCSFWSYVNTFATRVLMIMTWRVDRILGFSNRGNTWCFHWSSTGILRCHWWRMIMQTVGWGSQPSCRHLYAVPHLTWEAPFCSSDAETWYMARGIKLFLFSREYHFLSPLYWLHWKNTLKSLM